MSSHNNFHRNIQESKDLSCSDLPSKPNSKINKILVTGASGYIGGRLVPELLARGYQVRAMVRRASPEYQALWPEAEIAVADVLDEKLYSLEKALEGIDTAYYLLHSLNLGLKEFEAADIKAAVNFRRAADEQRIQRIIYLGGLGDIQSSLSSHLRSRMEVAEELKRGKVPVTILRAGVIIGSGSASFEIILHLVKKLYIVLVPRWAKNRCQPIAIRDVIKYLVGVLEVPETTGKNFDIGGKDILTYEKMLKILSRILNQKRIFMHVPFSNIGAYAYFASLLTPVPASITQCLMEGLKNEVVCQNILINSYLPFEPMSYREAIVRAISREEQDRVYTRWSDAYPPAHELAIKLHELKTGPAYSTRCSILADKSAESLFKSLCHVGGKKGWFQNNWMWRFRGLLDRMLGGVGTSRGRRSYSSLKINDVIDFWRIEDIKEGQRLLLRAEMKLPGKAWLEFNIEEVDNMRKLSVIAYYNTRSLWGRLYWYGCLPFHFIIFKKLLVDIEKRSLSKES
ncbi:MAG: epimerase [Omnitrophica bacterium RIFCSPLOWO2_12_FULL_44_17]|uniref:Epimerase n=1 Tax=Candidatus Danuiimicrobium aquiferis TaxID=1801832 RepID=A0A1G1L2E3_9BACT|nr:MAG: epimerase [Omnitrophica bacterium RIFCSPHIGHO2_02_FULL_45_28]OGW99317.1 MAG: epimerase [Omnitrophica bacterium RIFCSPLOWO2_12_FULL_44_17]OGX02483.1 MAG: epimerase [Omnitrophica bacterium RIFCSPLOWO2_02_FULL_44_11]